MNTIIAVASKQGADFAAQMRDDINAVRAELTRVQPNLKSKIDLDGIFLSYHIAEEKGRVYKVAITTSTEKDRAEAIAAVEKMAPSARALVIEPLAPDNTTQTKKFFQTLHS